MKVIIVFLLGSFIAAGSPRVRAWLSKPPILLAICIILCATFLSLKISG